MYIIESMNIGCHVPIAKGIEKAPEMAAKWGCEAMQIFTHPPQGGRIRIGRGNGKKFQS